MNNEKIYSTPELAARWGFNKNAVTRMIERGSLKATRLAGRFFIITESEVARFEASRVRDSRGRWWDRSSVKGQATA